MNAISTKEPQPFTLRLKSAVVDCVDGAVLQPSLLANKSRAEIASIPIEAAGRMYRVADFFELINDPSEHLVIHGDCRHIARLGAGMKAGQLSIMGHAGVECGAELAGGTLEVFGNAGDRLAIGMRRGQIVVHGSAGSDVAGPSVGATRGMQGGDCIILGNVGNRLAERMRRGVLWIGGNAGDYGAAQMIAGTLVVMGRIGHHWAEGMRRGTIILPHAQPDSFAAHLTSAREFELSFLPLLWKHLQSILSERNQAVPNTRWAKRQMGDRSNEGLGEVLTLTRHAPSFAV
jgi:formylmethanofuran dehydrogenase subunit C